MQVGEVEIDERVVGRVQPRVVACLELAVAAELDSNKAAVKIPEFAANGPAKHSMHNLVHGDLYNT